MSKLEIALFNSLKKHTINEITITLLCKEASINRSTFYTYFHSITELLDYFQEQYIKQFLREIKQQWITVDDITNYYFQLLQHIYENKSIFYCLYVYDNTIGFIDRTATLSIDNLTPISKEYPAISKQDRLFVKMFNSYGCNGIIKLWLMNDCEEPVSDMAELLFRYTTRTLLINKS